MITLSIFDTGCYFYNWMVKPCSERKKRVNMVRSYILLLSTEDISLCIFEYTLLITAAFWCVLLDSIMCISEYYIYTAMTLMDTVAVYWK